MKYILLVERFIYFSVYDDPCDFYGTIYSRTCPQEIIDLGLTCGCPINPVHLVRSHLSAVGSSYSDFLLTPILDILSGQFEIKVIPSAFGFLATVSIHNLLHLYLCIFLNYT